MFNFDPNTKHNTGAALIPARTLAFALVTVKEMRQSQGTGGGYANLELTIAHGEYERRKIFTMICDPSDAKNSEKWREMGVAALQHALEAAGVLNPADPATYQKATAASFDDLIAALDGHTVAIKVSVEKGQDSYPDRNGVAAWLSPNPASSTFREFEKLANPSPSPTPAPALAQSGFSAPAAATGFGTPAWLK